MIVIGIDPGVVKTGFAAVEKIGSSFKVREFGVIQPDKALPLEQKLIEIFDKVNLLCEKYQPSESAVEEIFFSRNARSAIMVGEARGTVLLAFAKNGVKPYGYTPKEIKLAVVGTGTAEKSQVSRMVSLLTGVREKEHLYDAYDAVAAAICHMNKTVHGVNDDRLS